MLCISWLTSGLKRSCKSSTNFLMIALPLPAYLPQQRKKTNRFGLG
jgi:hypothetical protein